VAIAVVAGITSPDVFGVNWKSYKAKQMNMENVEEPWNPEGCDFVWSERKLRSVLLRLGYDGKPPNVRFNSGKGAVVIAPGPYVEWVDDRTAYVEKGIEFRDLDKQGDRRFIVEWGFRNYYKYTRDPMVSDSTGDSRWPHEILVVEVPKSARRARKRSCLGPRKPK
jgi:hypothetical protein